MKTTLTCIGILSLVVAACGDDDDAPKADAAVADAIIEPDAELAPDAAPPDAAITPFVGHAQLVVSKLEIPTSNSQLDACSFDLDGNAGNGDAEADALAAINTTVNRVSGIYEREVAIRLVLVADNDQIIYTNPGTDPYPFNDSSVATVLENQTNLDNEIGSANYDVGHVFNTGGGGLGSAPSRRHGRETSGPPKPKLGCSGFRISGAAEPARTPPGDAREPTRRCCRPRPPRLRQRPLRARPAT